MGGVGLIHVGIDTLNKTHFLLELQDNLLRNKRQIEEEM